MNSAADHEHVATLPQPTHELVADQQVAVFLLGVTFEPQERPSRRPLDRPGGSAPSMFTPTLKRGLAITCFRPANAARIDPTLRSGAMTYVQNELTHGDDS